MRKTVNKFLDKKYRELAMWSIALLVNTSTWYEFQNNWKLICVVFLRLHSGKQNTNNQDQDILIDKISKLRSDPNMVNAIRCSGIAKDDDDASDSFDSNTYTFVEDEEDNCFEPKKRLPGKKKVRKVIY